MEQFFDLVGRHQSAILVLLFCVGVFLFSLQWVLWLFAKGRFHVTSEKSEKLVAPARPQGLRYLVADGLVKIINDFRHLLALIIVSIFGLAVFWTLYQVGPDVDDMKEVLQAVAATLGGLVGSIIGYYFGESAARKTNAAPTQGDDAPPVIAPQAPPAGGAAPAPGTEEVKEVITQKPVTG